MPEFRREIEREDLRLARACLLLARDFHPLLDVDAYLARFDEWAALVGARAESKPFPVALAEVLAGDEGFRGAVEDYLAPENSLLDSVMDRKRGQPITLSIVWLEVARRLHKPLVAVGMPGHFLVRHEDELLDPFHGGGRITEADAARLLEASFGGRFALAPAMLAPTSDRDVLTRVLTNLKNAFLHEMDPANAVRVEDRILELNPYAFPEYRDRGLLKRSLGDAAGALRDLARYVEAMPTAPDAAAVRRLMSNLGP